MNAAWGRDREGGWIDDDKPATPNPEWLSRMADAEDKVDVQIVSPAPVAPGEPSKEAMQAAVNILKSIGIVSISKEHAYAEIIDAAFAPKLERRLKAENENVMKWVKLNQLTERERDEAMAELKAERDAREHFKVKAGEACVAAAEEFLAGMGEPVDLEEVTIPRKEFERAKKVIATIATLRQQLAERDATIERLNRTVAKHMLRAAKDGWQQGETAFKLLLSDPDFYRAEENAKVV